MIGTTHFVTNKVDELSSELETVQTLDQENQRKNEKLESQSSVKIKNFTAYMKIGRNRGMIQNEKLELGLDEGEITFEIADTLNGGEARPRLIIV